MLFGQETENILRLSIFSNYGSPVKLIFPVAEFLESTGKSVVIIISITTLAADFLLIGICLDTLSVSDH